MLLQQNPFQILWHSWIKIKTTGYLWFNRARLLQFDSGRVTVQKEGSRQTDCGCIPDLIMSLYFIHCWTCSPERRAAALATNVCLCMVLIVERWGINVLLRKGSSNRLTCRFPLASKTINREFFEAAFLAWKEPEKEENAMEQKPLSPGGEVLWLVMVMCLKAKAWRRNWGLVTGFELRGTVPLNERLSSLYPFSNIMLTACDKNIWLNYFVSQQSSHTPVLGKSVLIILISSAEIPFQQTASLT